MDAVGLYQASDPSAPVPGQQAGAKRTTGLQLDAVAQLLSCVHPTQLSNAHSLTRTYAARTQQTPRHTPPKRTQATRAAPVPGRQAVDKGPEGLQPDAAGVIKAATRG